MKKFFKRITQEILAKIYCTIHGHQEFGTILPETTGRLTHYPCKRCEQLWELNAQGNLSIAPNTTGGELSHEEKL